MKIELVAKQIFKFRGKLRQKGERIFANPPEAKALIAYGRAVTAEPEPAATEATEPKPKRTYKRRDMQAETLSETTAEVTGSTVSTVAVPEKSLVDEVARVKDEYRAKAVDTPWNFTLTRPKKDTAKE